LSGLILTLKIDLTILENKTAILFIFNRQSILQNV